MPKPTNPNIPPNLDMNWTYFQKQFGPQNLTGKRVGRVLTGLAKRGHHFGESGQITRLEDVQDYAGKVTKKFEALEDPGGRRRNPDRREVSRGGTERRKSTRSRRRLTALRQKIEDRKKAIVKPKPKVSKVMPPDTTKLDIAKQNSRSALDYLNRAKKDPGILGSSVDALDREIQAHRAVIKAADKGVTLSADKARAGLSRATVPKMPRLPGVLGRLAARLGKLGGGMKALAGPASAVANAPRMIRAYQKYKDLPPAEGSRRFIESVVLPDSPSGRSLDGDFEGGT